MIIIVTQCFPPRIGGIETLMLSLADALQRDGEEVLVIADSKNKKEREVSYDKDQAYSIIRCGGLKFFRKVKKRRVLQKMVQLQKVKAVFTDSWKSSITIAAITKKYGISLLCFAHGNEVLPRPDFPQKEIHVRKAFSSVSKIIAVSQSTAQLVEYYETDKKKCSVIYNLVPPPESGVHKNKNLQQVEQGIGSPTLLTPGRIEPRKGHDQVIKSLPALKKEFPNIKYWIAGTGDDQGRLEKLAQKHNVCEQVVFWGSVDEKLKSLLLDRATLMVMPNRHEQKGRSIEGFGLVYIEAAYHRLPVIAGKSGGAVEAVIDNETGVLCEGNDQKQVESAIIDLLYCPGKMKIFAEQGYQKAVERHNPSYVVKQYKALFE